MQRYWIPEHIHVCILQDVVWLNETTNKYLTIDGAAKPMLAQIIHGWPPDESAPAVAFSDEQRAALVSKLKAKGLVSASLGDGKRYAPLVDQVGGNRAELERKWGVAIPWHFAARLVAAFVKAKVSLRVGGLRFALSSVEQRKGKLPADSIVHIDTLRELLDAFVRLRLFLYTPKRNCLLDSLVLAHFLLASRVAPAIVFGVSVRPFHAHCWSEWEGLVLNGGADVASLHQKIREI